MGRKQNPSQRTKGNLKPSSSAKAAELLEASGNAGGGFLGFGLLGSSAQESDEVDYSIDSDFAVVMKKMTKKDTTTKLRAVQEFSKLCQEKEIGAVSSVLQYWPKIFTKLSADCDSHVREATNEALEQLVIRVRRNLAPHLKLLMGPWMVAQCDVYAPAASAAKSAFSSAFSDDKKIEAVGFCKAEILMHIEDILMKQQQPDPKMQADEQDEVSRRQIQLLSSALESISLFTALLSSKQLDLMLDNFSQILKNSKFWKFGKHPSCLVRTGFFHAIASFAEFCPKLVTQFGDNICPAVLYNLDESDPMVAPALWITVLHVITVTPDCWSKINPKKGMYPKLWTFLKNGGFGCAVLTYPNLLPFLSLLPLESVADKIWLSDKFFNEMKAGLAVQQVQQSSGELNAIVKAFMECILFCVKQCLVSTSPDRKLLEYLTMEQVIPLVNASITETSSALSKSRLYKDLVTLLAYIQRMVESEVAEDCRTDANTIAESIFNEMLENVSKTVLSRIEEGDAASLSRIAVFIESFSPHQVEAKDLKSTKKLVKFSDTVHTDDKERQISKDNISFLPEMVADKQNLQDQKNVAKADDLENVNEALNSEMLHKTVVKRRDDEGVKIAKFEALEKSDVCEEREMDVSDRKFVLKPSKKMSDLVNAVCLRSVSLAKEHKDIGRLALFSRTFKAFASTELIQFLISHLSSEEAISPDDDHLAWYVTDFLMPWMIETRLKESFCGSEITSYLSDVAMVVWNLMDGQTKVGILSHLIRNSRGCRHLLLHLVSSNSEDTVSEWLCKDEFGDYMVSIAGELCQRSSECSGSEVVSEQNEKWSLLCFALSAGENGEPKVAEKYLNLLLGIIHSFLPSQLKSDDESVDECVSFVCDITFHFLANMSDCLAVPSYEGLLLSIYQLSLQPSFLSTGVLEKVRKTWKCGFELILRRTGFSLSEDSFLGKAAACLREYAHNGAETVLRLSQLADIGMQLTNIVLDVFDEVETVTGSFAKHLCFKFDDSEMAFWKGALIADGELLFSSADLSEIGLTAFDVVLKCAAPVTFTSMLLVRISSCCENPDATKVSLDSEEENQTQFSDAPLKDASSDSGISAKKEHPIKKLLAVNTGVYVDIALGLAFCKAVLKNRNFDDLSSEFSELTSVLEKNFISLTGTLSSEVLGTVLAEAFQQSLEKGDLWSRGLFVLLQRMQELQFGSDHVNNIGGLDRFYHVTLTVVETLRVAVPFFEVEHVVQLADFCLAQMISFPTENVAEFLESITLALVTCNAILALNDLHCSAKSAAFTDLLSATLLQIHDWRERDESIFLFNTHFTVEHWRLVAFNSEVIRFYTLAVSRFPTSLDNSHWDAILCSMVSWIQSISEVQTRLTDDLLALTLTSATCDLLQAVDVCMQFVLPEQPSSFPPDILSEWKDVFSETAYEVLLPVFVNVSEKASAAQVISQEYETLLYHLCSAVVYCQPEILNQHKLRPKLVADVGTNLPDSLQTLLNYCCPLLLSGRYHIQLTVYRLLLKVIPELSKYNEKSLNVDNDTEEVELVHFPLQSLIEVIESGNTAIRSLLFDAKFDETVMIDPSDPVFASVMSYLLSWNVLLHFFNTSLSEQRVQYAQWISNRGIMNLLLQNLFSLMPQNPVILLKDTLVTNTTSKKLTNSRNMFAEEPSFELRHFNTGQAVTFVQHLACAVYRRTLETLPAIVRQWWMEQDKQVSGIVERFTAKHVSPLLCAKELQTIQETSGNFANMTVRVRPLTREVIAVYSLEDCNMELIITLPANMPFGAVSVESGNRVGVTKPQWRTWVLHLYVFLSFQNGSILDALSLWKRNVDKQFEGLEDCMICFSVIHGSNNKLPKCQCKTCKKRFHSTCLLKWFKTSANSACPLCRNLF